MVTSKEVEHALVVVGVVSNIKINRPPRVFLVHQQDEKPGVKLCLAKMGGGEGDLSMFTVSNIHVLLKGDLAAIELFINLTTHFCCNLLLSLRRQE